MPAIKDRLNIISKLTLAEQESLKYILLTFVLATLKTDKNINLYTQQPTTAINIEC